MGLKCQSVPSVTSEQEKSREYFMTLQYGALSSAFNVDIYSLLLWRSWQDQSRHFESEGNGRGLKEEGGREGFPCPNVYAVLANFTLITKSKVFN